MKKTYKCLISLFALIFLISGCTGASNGENRVMEFFGFNTSASQNADKKPESQNQNVPEADANPFGTNNSNNIDEVIDLQNTDPALVEIDEPTEKQANNNGYSTINDDWDDDPAAWSFSDSGYEDVPVSSEQKNTDDISQSGFHRPEDSFRPENPYPYLRPTPTSPSRPFSERQQPFNNPYGYQDHPQEPPFYFYRIQDNPIFRPMCELPRTGITKEVNSGIKENVSYASTSMVLSIPTLNVTEDIVVVPLVDDNYPVEFLGERIGLLEGSGPGEEDLFVLVGHNHINAEDQGPFVELSAMKTSDLIFIRGAKDASRTFVVYANEKFASDDMDGLLSYAKPGCMILITCEDESIEGGYLNRRVIFAEAKED